MAAVDIDANVASKLESPLLEEGSEWIDPSKVATRVVLPYLARLYRVGAKLFAKACGVAIGWSWSDAIHSSFDDKLVPAYATAFSGIIYALLMTAITSYMVVWIAQGAGDPDNIEFGRFGANSRELLLIVQPMVLAWAWKDALRDALWERLPQDSELILLLGRFCFALLATAAIAKMVEKFAQKLQELEEMEHDAEEQHIVFTSKDLKTYSMTALSLLSGAFGLFLAWCWNAVAQTLGETVSPSVAATAITTLLYAIGVTGLASWVTVQISQVISRGVDPRFAFMVKFIDLFQASLGYIVGWAWSDAMVHVLIEGLAMTDMKLLYLIYSVLVTIGAILFANHMSKLVDDPNTPVLVRQYMTLFLNALALMVGWSWKSYIQYFVETLPGGSMGRIMSNYFQAITMTIIACYVYHRINMMAQRYVDAENAAVNKMVENAGNQMD